MSDGRVSCRVLPRETAEEVAMELYQGLTDAPLDSIQGHLAKPGELKYCLAPLRQKRTFQPHDRVKITGNPNVWEVRLTGLSEAPKPPGQWLLLQRL